MLKYTNFDIVFSEIPEEVTLAINISNCPNRCKGCHSPYLQEDIGFELTNKVLKDIVDKYKNSITCICFMGGDASPDEVCSSAVLIKETYNNKIKTAWYSGKNKLENDNYTKYFNYLKLGSYNEEKGPLNKPTTNQRLYKIVNNKMIDITKELQ
ncbi:MAG: anaerobic ribonucleoside-triphosphate reductase activating protein [Bacteroidales bacterium]|jgi:anaerobic ribonucleoside-triphosphate reductase activating protein